MFIDYIFKTEDSDTSGVSYIHNKDGKYLIYLPKDLAEDSMFPFKGDSIHMKVSFEMGGDEKLVVEKWTEPVEEKN